MAKFFGVNPRSLQRQYKDYLSDFKSWDQKQHATDWILFANNLGSNLSLDETAFSNGDLYTILTNKKAKGKKGALVAMVRGTKAETVIKILHKIPLKQRNKVKEVTLDMASNMGLIVKKSFPKATLGSSPKVVGFQDYAKIVASLNRKKSTFFTPLNCALKAFIFALNDSAEALVLRLSK